SNASNSNSPSFSTSLKSNSVNEFIRMVKEENKNKVNLPAWKDNPPESPSSTVLCKVLASKYPPIDMGESSGVIVGRLKTASIFIFGGSFSSSCVKDFWVNISVKIIELRKL